LNRLPWSPGWTLGVPSSSISCKSRTSRTVWRAAARPRPWPPCRRRPRLDAPRGEARLDWRRGRERRVDRNRIGCGGMQLRAWRAGGRRGCSREPLVCWVLPARQEDGKRRRRSRAALVFVVLGRGRCGSFLLSRSVSHITFLFLKSYYVSHIC
jgi:hypothetical protein